MRRLVGSIVLWMALLGMAGCPIAPGPGTPRPRRDAGVGADAGPRPGDAGVRGCGPVTPCPEGTMCSPDGVCVISGGACTRSEQCAGLEVCAGGRCAEPTGRCSADDACGGRRCLPSGWCAPSARLVEDQLVANCSGRAECGILGVCRQGACRDCLDDRDCGGTYQCGFDGVCREPFSCAGRVDCAPGNACVDGSCVPSEAGCSDDGGDDEAAGARLLTGGATLAASTCGDDVDWWSFDLAPGQGARVVATTDVRRNQVDLQVSFEKGPLERNNRLSLPGIDVVEVVSSTSARKLLMRVSVVDAAGRYDLSVAPTTSACAGDPLDLYGDSRPIDALAVDTTGDLGRVACPGDVDLARLPVEAGDAITVSPSLDGPGVLRAELQSSAGAVLASGRYTTSGEAPLVPAPPAAADAWHLAVRAENVPLEGTSYSIVSTRVRGSRRAECTASATVAPGTTRLALSQDLDGPACTPAAPRAAFDRIVRVAAPRDGALLRVTARPTSTVSRAQVGVAIIDRCDDDASARVCDVALDLAGAASVEQVLGTAPVFVVVSSTTATEVDLVTTIDERGNYTCRNGGATPILASGELVSDTFGATDTVEATAPNCGLSAGEGSGPDRFYVLSLGAQERAVLELEGERGGLLWVSTDCERMTDSCVGAATSALGAPGRVVLTPNRASNFLVAVDGVGEEDAGRYVLRTRLRPDCVSDTECTMPARCDDFVCRPPPGNDRCEGEVVALASGTAVIEGSTGAARDDFSSDACPSGAGSQDVVYAIDVPSGVTELRARVTRASWDPILVLRSGSCGSSAGEVACNDDRARGRDLLPEVAIASPVPGRYYLIVDAFDGAGTFTLEVSAR